MRKMKDSGIAWIGEIPESWSVKKSKYIAKTYTGNSIKDEEKYLYENPTNAVPYVATKDINADTSKIDCSNVLYIQKDDTSFVRAEEGDVLMCIEGGSAGRKKAKLSQRACFVNKLCCFHTETENKTFLFYALMSPHYEEEFKLNISGLIGGVSRNKLDNFYIALPSVEEQQKIADFLDKKCAEIDKLIELQESMIEKLKEYKQSVITQAVTKGLDPNVPMKDSGIEWIGIIPEGWNVNIGKRILILQKREVLPSDEVITCFRDGEVTLRKNRREEGFTFSEKEIGYQGIEIGDIVIHGMDGFAGAIGISDSRGKGSPVLSVCISKSNMDANYIVYYLRTLARNNVFLALATGIRERSCDLRWNKIANLDFIIPDLEEQQQIADYLDKKCAEIDDLIKLKEQKIEKLKEYKKSLIYEYVTGKKEVV